MNTLRIIIIIIAVGNIVVLLAGHRKVAIFLIILGLALEILIEIEGNKERFMESCLYNLDRPDTAEPTQPGVISCVNGKPITYYPMLIRDDDRNITSKNASLYTGGYPLTTVPPPMAAPLADLDTWRMSPSTTHSHVNSRTVQEDDNWYDTYRDRSIYDRYDPQTDQVSFAKSLLYEVPNANHLTSYAADNTLDTCYDRLVAENKLVEPFVSELQPNILTDVPKQPILSNLGLVDTAPQRKTVLYTPVIDNTVYNDAEIYAEDGTDDHAPRSDGYATLNSAYRLPRRYPRTSANLPQRYGRYHKQHMYTPTGTREACVQDLSGAQEMSEYVNSRNKLDMFDVNRYAPLYKIQEDSIGSYIDVTNRSRSDLQNTMMRKRNAEAWQRKEYPMDMNPRRMLGSADTA